MARKTTVIREERSPARVGGLTLLARALMGIFILGVILLLSRPGTLDGLQEQFQDRLSLRSGTDTHGGVTRGDAQLANLFTPEVLFWAEDIKRWGVERSLNPNLIATIIQIESCGDPYISSHVGAQGLFQVMPFHFETGENQLNTEKNAQRGLNHLVECLTLSNYDVGISFACYNGGASVIYRAQNQWAQESRDYFVWGSGIYADATVGAERSPTLDQWLAAGGANLCARASQTQTQVMPNLVRKP